jgi:hypothetical protein
MSLSFPSTVQTGCTLPCFLWGIARTGTNLVCWALEKADGIQCFNENRDEAFTDYFLRANPVLARLVEGCPTGRIFFKSFNDTPRADAVMDFFPTARAIYTIRRPDHAIYSFDREFGDMGFVEWQRRFGDAAAGRPGRLLEMAGRSPALHELIRRTSAEAVRMLDRYGRTHQNVAALYYLWQNFFHARLRRKYAGRILTVDYDQLVVQPQRVLGEITSWFGCAPSQIDLSTIHMGRAAEGDRGGLSDDLRRQCWALYHHMRDTVRDDTLRAAG